MFYGAEQAKIHDGRFGALAANAAADLVVLLEAAGHRDGVVVDLGCGSGILSGAVVDAGYAVVGVDISPDMVALAKVRAPTAALAVGSLHDFALPNGCVAVCAAGEALNYATDPRAGLAALRALAQRTHAALAVGGVFLFDVAGPGRAGPSRSVRQFHPNEDWCLGMLATESDDRRRLDRAITIFTVEHDGRYRRIEEHHVLHLYDESELVEMLSGIGFRVEVRAGYGSESDPPAWPGWYVVVARKL